MAIRPVARPSISAALNPWAQMVEGLRYVRRNRLVLGAISLDLFAVLLGGATAMLPVFARDVLHAGPEGLGHLRAAPAVGATLTAAFFAVRPLKSEVGVKMLLAVAAFGAATIAFGLSRNMAFSLACLAVLGSADMFSVYVRQSLIQLYTPDAMRGRVGAVSSLFISASNELGEARIGLHRRAHRSGCLGHCRRSRRDPRRLRLVVVVSRVAQGHDLRPARGAWRENLSGC